MNTPLETLEQTPNITITSEPKKSINIYPSMRSAFFVVLVIIACIALLSLVYLNGKSIYENGL